MHRWTDGPGRRFRSPTKGWSSKESLPLPAVYPYTVFPRASSSVLSGSEGDVDYRQANRQVQWNVVSAGEEEEEQSVGSRRMYHQDL